MQLLRKTCQLIVILIFVPLLLSNLAALAACSNPARKWKLTHRRKFQDKVMEIKAPKTHVRIG